MTPPSAAATLRAPAVAPHPGRRRGVTRPVRPPVPRRVSGPVRRRAPAVQRLPDRLVDRLIGGRVWIAVIAFALIGIVAMQLWVVKLGVGIGRALEHTQLLQRENAVLASEDSALSSAERIERLALAKGMVFASPGALHFDTVDRPLDVRRAVAVLANPIQSPTAAAATGAPEAGAAGASTGAPEAGAAAAGGASETAAAGASGGASGVGTAATAGASPAGAAGVSTGVPEADAAAAGGASEAGAAGASGGVPEAGAAGASGGSSAGEAAGTPAAAAEAPGG